VQTFVKNVKGGRGERKMGTESREQEKIAQEKMIINQYKSFIHALPLFIFISSIDHFASPRCDMFAMGTERAF